ncbi:MAG: AI-2E family transporter [Armatimonadota bacterium]
MATNVETAIRVIWGLLVRLVVVTGTAYVLYRVRSILISLILAILLTYALLPLVDWLCAKRIKGLHHKTQRLLATIITFIVFIGFVGGCVTVMVTPFTEEVTRFTDNVQEYGNQTKAWLASAGKWYAKTVPADMKVLIGKMDPQAVPKALGKYTQGALDTTKSWVKFALDLVLIPVIAFYFVLDHRSLTREMYSLVPRKRRREAVRIGHEAGAILKGYVVGQIILCALAGLLTGLFLTIMGVPYVVVLALFAAVTRAIPVIGPVVSGIPIVLVGLLNFPGLGMAAWLTVFVVVMHFAESKFIMPRLIGARLHLHPAVVIIVLLIGAEFFGLIGMFLAAPVAAIVRELLRLYYVRPPIRGITRKEQADAAII